MEAHFEVEGLQELERDLLKLEHDVSLAFLADTLKEATDPVRNEMKDRVKNQFTERSGQLIRIRRNVRKFRGNRKAIHSVNATIGPTRKARYAIHLEYGTQHIKANPFMRPALDNNVGTVIQIFRKRLKERIARHIKGV